MILTFCKLNYSNLSDKNTKEVSRTLTEQQMKINTTNSNYEAINKRLDSEIKHTMEMFKDTHKDDNKGIDENKFNLRIERLGKEISLVKNKQSEQTQQYDNSALRQTSIEQQTSNILKTLDKQQKDIMKIAACENNIKGLEDKILKNESKGEQLIQEMTHKADKTYVEEVKIGLDKDKSKITYFQDKISNIAKSVDGVKIEINNMSKCFFKTRNFSLFMMLFLGDKFCSDIENHDETLKTISNTIKKHGKDLAENSESLNGITNESLEKLKEMATNCVQVETNIRSIRDKSILFDNDIKHIKDQLVHLKRDKSKSRPPTSEAEFTRQLKLKDDEIKGISELVKDLKRKLNTVGAEINNLKEDKRTKDVETEERQASLEQLLSDVRGWVETMLNETNKQLGEIAVEVENANVKITKCASDLSEVYVQHASSTGDISFVSKNLEDKISEVKEYGSIQQRELLDKILDLRGSFVDNQTEFVEKLKIANESMATLREDLNSKIDKIDANLTRRIDMKPKTSIDNSEFTQKVDAVSKALDGLKSEAKEIVKENNNKFTKINSELASFKVLCEKSNITSKQVEDNLGKLKSEFTESSSLNKKVNEENCRTINNLQNTFESNKINFEGKLKDNTSTIKVCDEKTNDIAEKLQKVISSNESLNNKIKSVQQNVEKFSNESMKGKSVANVESDAKMKKEFELLKNELKNADLESFKNTVNHTTETHNKLISALQKSVDLIVCDKTILESQAAVLDSKVSDFISERELYESQLKDKLNKMNHSIDNNQSEIAKNSSLFSTYESKAGAIDKMQKSVDEIFDIHSTFKKDINLVLKQINDKLTNDYENTKREVEVLKEKIKSHANSEESKKEIKELSALFQEKIDVNINKMNEAYEIIHNHTKVIDNLTESVNQVNRNYEFSDSQIQKVELKLTSCIDELSKLDLFVTAAEMKKLERTVNAGSNKCTISEVETKIEAAKQDLEASLRNTNNRLGHIEESNKDFYSKLDNISDLSNFANEVQALSSKVNQQKAKMIDLEANLTMQERITSKISDDVKRASFGTNKMGSPIGKANSGDLVNGDLEMSSKFKEEISDMKTLLGKKVDLTDINKTNKLISEECEKLEKKVKDLSTLFSSMKNNFESKSISWDKKIDQADLNKAETFLKGELNNLEDKIKSIQIKSEELKSNNAKKDEFSDMGQKLSLQAMESNFFKKDEIRAIENKIMGSVSKIEKSVSSLESNSKDSSNKISDFDRKIFDINDKVSSLANFKTKVEPKISTWDKKVDTENLRKIEDNFEDKFSKMKSDFTSQNDKIKASLGSSNNDKRDDKFDEKVSHLEKKFSKIENETNNKLNDALRKITSVEKDVQNLNQIKSSVDSINGKLSKKVESSALDIQIEEIKKVKLEVNAMKENCEKVTADLQNIEKANTGNNIEKKINEKIANTENKLAILENFRKETEVKLQDLKNEGNKIASNDIDGKLTNKVNVDDLKKLEVNLKAEIQQTKTNIEYTLEKVDNLHSTVSTVKDSTKSNHEVSDIKQNLNDIKSTMSSSLNGVQSKISELSSELLEAKSSINSKLNSNKTDIDSLKNDLTVSNNEISKLKKDTAVLSENQNLYANKKESEQTSVKSEEIVALTASLNVIKCNVEKLESERNTMQKTIQGDIITELSSLSKQINELNVKIGGLEENSTLKQIETDLRSEIKIMKSNIETAFNKNDDLSMKIKNLSEDNLNNKKAENINEIERKLKITLDKNSESISSIKARLEDIVKKLNSSVEKEELGKYRSEIQVNIDKLSGDNVRFNQEVNDLKSELSLLSDTTKKLTSIEKEKSSSESSDGVSKTAESRITAGMAQMENKIAIFDASRKEINQKLTDLSLKQQKINEEFGGMSEIKEKLKSKSDMWDKKADSKMVESMIKTQVDSLKNETKDLKSKIESKIDEQGNKSTNQIEKINSELKTLNMGIQNDKMNDLAGKLSKFEENMTKEINNMKNDSAKQLKMEDVEKNTSALKKEISDLMKQCEVLELFKKNTMIDIKTDKEAVSKLQNDMVSFNKSITDLKNLISNELTKATDMQKSINGSNKDKDIYESSLKKIEDNLQQDKDKLQTIENKLNCIDINSLVKKNDINGLVKNQELSDYVKKVESQSFVKKEEVIGFMKKDEITGFMKKDDIKDFLRREDIKGYVLKNDIEDFLTKGDISGYVKMEDINGFVKKDEVTSDVKQLKTFINEELLKIQKCNEGSKTSENTVNTNISELKSNFISKQDFAILGLFYFHSCYLHSINVIFSDINLSKLSEIVDHIQGETQRYNQDTQSQIETLESDLKQIKTKVDAKQTNAIGNNFCLFSC